MNQTEQLFNYFFAFGVGWAIAYIFKNFSAISERFGYLLCFIVGLPVIMGLLLAAAMISDHKEITLSLAFLAGFLIRLLRRA